VKKNRWDMAFVGVRSKDLGVRGQPGSRSSWHHSHQGGGSGEGRESLRGDQSRAGEEDRIGNDFGDLFA